MGTLLLVLYVIAGLVVYALADTTRIAGELERTIPLLNFGQAQSIVFGLCVALWPVWLVRHLLSSR